MNLNYINIKIIKNKTISNKSEYLEIILYFQVFRALFLDIFENYNCEGGSNMHFVVILFYNKIIIKCTNLRN